ncbi:glycosyltransferase family 39 protein [Chitinophaga sp. YIM B06452]|uniref:ArnT family glycosyltransferase n=1 Tax=Chitinophaga sp. YIM B06452 TaxID=3082158 RepID=UPI0031FEB932
MKIKSFRDDLHTAYTENRWLVLSALFILLLRLAFIGLMGLMPQDAYYTFYTEHPAASYYDHPPGIAWVLKIFTTVLGKKVYAVKLADTVVTLLTLAFFYRLSLRFLSRVKASNALLLFSSTLMITILSLVSTPDVPLMLCWTVSLLCLYKAVFLEKKVYWLLAGVMMGLAFDSKYTAVFLPAGLLLYLALSATHRKWLGTAWPWLSLVLMVVASAPVLWWNVQHDFASFRFQSTGRARGIAFSVTDFLGVLAHQAAILAPVLFFSLLWILYKIIRKYKAKLWTVQDHTLFLLCFFLPIFLAFLSISFIYWVKLNWMMPAYITGVIWVSRYFSHRMIRWQQAWAVVIHVALAIELRWYPVPVRSDDVWVGWGRMAGAVMALKRAYPADFIFSADDYKTSAVLNFYLEEMVYGQNIIRKPALQFDYVGTRLAALQGKNALFINSIPRIGNEVSEKRFADSLRRYFRNVYPLRPIEVKRGERLVRKFLVYRCEYYLPGRPGISER